MVDGSSVLVQETSPASSCFSRVRKASVCCSRRRRSSIETCASTLRRSSRTKSNTLLRRARVLRSAAGSPEPSPKDSGEELAAVALGEQRFVGPLVGHRVAVEPAFAVLPGTQPHLQRMEIGLTLEAVGNKLVEADAVGVPAHGFHRPFVEVLAGEDPADASLVGMKAAAGLVGVLAAREVQPLDHGQILKVGSQRLEDRAQPGDCAVVAHRRPAGSDGAVAAEEDYQPLRGRRPLLGVAQRRQRWQGQANSAEGAGATQEAAAVEAVVAAQAGVHRETPALGSSW